MQLFSALRYKNYRIYIVGQAFLNISNTMEHIIMAWLAYTLTSSIFVLGIVTYSRYFAAFFAGIFSGVIADRFNKRTILLISQFFMSMHAFFLAYLVYSELATIGILITLQIIAGFVIGLDLPSRSSFVNQMITDKKYLSNAIAFNSTVLNTASILGPAMAGALIPLAGEAFCFSISGITSIMVGIFFFFIKVENEKKKNSKLNFKSEFVEGIKYSFETISIKILLLLLLCLVLIVAPYTVLLPTISDEIFNGGVKVYGYMISATGLGAILGGIYLSTRPTKKLPYIILLGTFLFSIGLFIIALSKTLFITMFAVSIIGFGQVMAFAGTNTLLQVISAEDKLGRVLSIAIMLNMAAITLGGIFIGVMADTIGVLPTIFIESILSLIISFLYYRQIKLLKKRDKKIQANKIIY